MKDRFEMRFTGSGGQGVILASIIFAEVGVIAGACVTQSQAYGPEARGGLSKAETIISSAPIDFTKVEKPDLLLALTQSSLDKYAGALADGATIVMDEGLICPEGLSCRAFSLPILRTASEVIGRPMTANIVAVGAINAALGLFEDDIMLEAVKRHIPKGTEELNIRAFRAGCGLVGNDGAEQA